MSEHVNALLAGEELSEEFRAKATAIFEAAVKQKVAEEIAVLEEAFAATLEEEVGRIEEELSTNVDDYLNYVVEQWTAENEVAIEASLRSELTEEFISGLRNLFVEHYIDIPEEAVSVVEEMGNKVAELEEKLNEEIERSVALSKMLNESKSNEILLNACDGLTDTQAEKLKSLAEGIEYADANEYAQKVSILKENYFSTSVKSDNVLDSAESSTDGKGMISEELQGPMAAYVRSLGKTQLR
jgi:AcrR family transcriptional regulator